MKRYIISCRLNEALKSWIELLYPRLQNCAVCGTFVHGTAAPYGICPNCQDQWRKQFILDRPCPHCGFFTRGDSCRGPCQEGMANLRFVTAATPYEGIGRQMIQTLKYNGVQERAVMMGYLMAQTLAARLDCEGKSGYWLVPIPLHSDKEASRGFNQSALLAEQVGRCLGLPVHQLLLRQQVGEVQAGLNKARRLKEIENVFKLKSDQTDFKNRPIILVDDVVTTGATLLTCAKILKKCNCNDVTAVVFAAGGNMDIY